MAITTFGQKQRQKQLELQQQQQRQHNTGSSSVGSTSSSNNNTQQQQYSNHGNNSQQLSNHSVPLPQQPPMIIPSLSMMSNNSNNINSVVGIPVPLPLNNNQNQRMMPLAQDPQFKHTVEPIMMFNNNNNNNNNLMRSTPNSSQSPTFQQQQQQQNFQNNNNNVSNNNNHHQMLESLKLAFQLNLWQTQQAIRDAIMSEERNEFVANIESAFKFEENARLKLQQRKLQMELELARAEQARWVTDAQGGKRRLEEGEVEKRKMEKQIQELKMLVAMTASKAQQQQQQQQQARPQIITKNVKIQVIKNSLCDNNPVKDDDGAFFHNNNNNTNNNNEDDKLSTLTTIASSIFPSYFLSSLNDFSSSTTLDAAVNINASAVCSSSKNNNPMLQHKLDSLCEIYSKIASSTHPEDLDVMVQLMFEMNSILAAAPSSLVEEFTIGKLRVLVSKNQNMFAPIRRNRKNNNHGKNNNNKNDDDCDNDDDDDDNDLFLSTTTTATTATTDGSSSAVHNNNNISALKIQHHVTSTNFASSVHALKQTNLILPKTLCQALLIETETVMMNKMWKNNNSGGNGSEQEFLEKDENEDDHDTSVMFPLATAVGQFLMILTRRGLHQAVIRFRESSSILEHLREDLQNLQQQQQQKPTSTVIAIEENKQEEKEKKDDNNENVLLLLLQQQISELQRISNHANSVLTSVRYQFARYIQWLFAACPYCICVCDVFRASAIAKPLISANNSTTTTTTSALINTTAFTLFKVTDREVSNAFEEAIKKLELCPPLCFGKRIWPFLTCLYSCLDAIFQQQKQQDNKMNNNKNASPPSSSSSSSSSDILVSSFGKVFPTLLTCLNHCRNQASSRKRDNSFNDEEQKREEAITFILYHLVIVRCCEKGSKNASTLSFSLMSDYNAMKKQFGAEGIVKLKGTVASMLGIHESQLVWPDLNRLI